MKSAAQVFAEAKSRIREISPADAVSLRASTPSVVLIDCREPNEYNLGHAPGALFIPRGILESNVEANVPRDAKVVIYCASGNRSALAAEALQQMGYQDVASLAGGFRGWVEAGGTVEG